MTFAITSLALSVWIGSSPASLPPEPLEVAGPKPAQVRSRRLFIASGILMGVAFVGETTGAILGTTCAFDGLCAVNLRVPGSFDAVPLLAAMIPSGPESAYVVARMFSVPMMWTSRGLLLAGTQVRARDSHVAPASRRLGWALLGTGFGILIGSRLARLGFAIGKICQDPLCFYGFDQATLGVSRALSLPGSAFVMHRRTRARMHLDLGPPGTLGLGLSGQF